MIKKIKNIIIKYKLIIKPFLFTLIFLFFITIFSQGKITPLVYKLFD